MSDLLHYLDDADRGKLMTSARRVRFEPEQVILDEGEIGRAIYVIRSGEARVERRHENFHVEIARLGPGEIFGEMGFVEGHEASATVVAEGPCEIDVIDAGDVETLIETDPRFHGRFYQSLAAILSRRLRETTEFSLAEYAWGGNRTLESPEVRDPGEGWGGGSPLRDADAGED